MPRIDILVLICFYVEVEQANLIEAALRRNPNPSIDVKCWLVDGELLVSIVLLEFPK